MEIYTFTKIEKKTDKRTKKNENFSETPIIFSENKNTVIIAHKRVTITKIDTKKPPSGNWTEACILK